MTRPQAVKILKAIVYIGIYGGLLMPLVFVPKVIFPFVFSKLLYFQILVGLTFPAYLILVWIEPKLRPRMTPLYLALIAYFAAVALSVVFAVDVPRAWWGNQERMNGLFTVLHFFVWFSMMVSFLRTWEQWRKILLFEIVLSVIMAAVALLQIPFPNLLLFPAGTRVGGLLDNPIYMGAYQIFNLFFIALLWLKGASRPTKVWLVIAAMLDLAAFFAAASRGALLGLVVGAVAFVIAYVAMSPNKKAKWTVLTLALVAFLSYGAFYSLRNTDLIRNSPLVRLTDLSATTETRFIAWKIAWQGFLERPLTGWGFDDFHILFNLKYNPQSLEHGYYETWFDRSHNTVLDALSMTGILGFLTFFGTFAALFYSVVRAYRKKWIDIPTASIFFSLPIAYFIQNLFVFDQPAGFVMSFFLFALIACMTDPTFAAVPSGSVPSAEPGSPRRFPWVVFAVVQALGALLVWRTSVLPAEASSNAILANSYFNAGLYADALAHAKRAASIPTPYLDEQTFLLSRNMISLNENNTIDKVPNWKEWHDLTIDVTERYVKDHPRNTNPLYVYGSFLQAYAPRVPEDGPRAERAFLAAIKTSPKRQQLLYTLGRFYIAIGKKQEGYNLFKQAVDDDPNVGDSHWYAGLSLIYDLNRIPEGSQELVAAMKASSPYSLREVREATALADAYAVLHNKEDFPDLVAKLQTLPRGNVQLYLQIARDAETLGLIDLRNRILAALIQIEPALAPHFTPLQNGSATSIEQSFKMTQNVVLPAPAVPSPAPTQSTTTGSVDSGPRLKK